MAAISLAAGEVATQNALFARIAQFLIDQRLSPEPGHYAFAYHVLSDDNGPLAHAVATLTQGGVRLSGADIVALGGQSSQALAPLDAMPAPDGDDLAARTEQQVAEFATMAQAIQDETRGFGRDLAASVAAIRQAGTARSMDDLVRLTGTMVERVRVAEERLEQATQEAIELRQQLAEARGSACSDPLTELPNRRGFEAAFAAAAATAAPLAVALCDVDHFKEINDRFGHAVGDRVLRALGQALATRCGGHLVARYGGEEFAVLFDTADLASAAVVLDEAREAVAARRFRLRESDVALGTITFSAGIAALDRGEELTGVLDRADRALYRAKADGRNCVRAAASAP